MHIAALVSLALDALKCSQKELAARLNVSPAQISKWKKDEYMSTDMQDKLTEIAGIGQRIPDFVVMAGSLEDAIKWERLLCHLADLAVSGAETGYHTYRLEDAEEADFLYWDTFNVLAQMGVELPKSFPAALDFDYDEDVSEDEYVARCERLAADPYASLISSIYASYTDVYGFYAAYVAELIDKLELFDSPACDIEPNLLALAATKLEVVPTMASKFRKFQLETQKTYKEALMFVKDQAFRAGMPLRAELLNLIHEDHDSLGQEAEAESLGFNDARLHPDVYMNELLVGMRVIHQVLPVLLKKLGIDEEFELDTSALHLR